MSSLIHIPEDFYCPITGQLMVDPVSDPEGHTYERLSIEEWLQQKLISPMTRTSLTVSQLIPNIAMRKIIESIREKISEEQLKKDSRITEIELKPFTDVLHNTEVYLFYNDNNLLVKISVPEVNVRPPVDIALCIDVSGSMGEEATLKGSSGETVHNGISVLSLTVAAAKTILNTLQGQDHISIITYTDKSKVIVSDMECSAENKTSISMQLDQLRPLNTTNLWSGIQTSLDTLRTTSPSSKQKMVFLLTDGIPNVEPPRGHEYMIEKYQRQHNFQCPITCYGFGYNLDSPLLDTISKLTGGDGYSFIPDSSLLGNVFIHGISNFLITAVSNVKLSLQCKRDVSFKDGTDNLDIHINSLKYGQTKNFMFELQGYDDYDDFVDVSLDLHGMCITTENIDIPDINYYNEQVFRHKCIRIINECVALQKWNEIEQVKQLINPFIEDMKVNHSIPFIRDMCIDFDGQIKEALNMTITGNREDWYNKWGKHYLLSLSTAYENELCNNFKDKGIAHFGGTLFHTLRDQVSDIFDDLPTPKQDIYHTMYRGGARVGYHPPPLSMSSYNSVTGGCCSGDSLILMADHSHKQASDIRKGDRVITHDSMISEVECVVKTTCPNRTATLVKLEGGLTISPWHPVIDPSRSTWEYPCYMTEPTTITCPTLYTFIIQNRGSLYVNGYIYSTLGHGLLGDVIEHDYYGTNKVIQDMKAFPTYEQGNVCLLNYMIKRNGYNGNVCKIEDDEYMAHM
jgi:uncharacterized protein YegL